MAQCVSYIADDLVDAQAMHLKYPDTFEVPSASELNRLKPGDSVKVCNGKERFWVKIKEIGDDTNLIVSVNNQLLWPIDYDYESDIIIKKKHIYAIC
jgi:hypothetical protein